MQHVLGHAVFHVPAHLRDDTAYIYASPDRSRSLRVSPMPESDGVDQAIRSSKAALDEFFGPLVIYSHSIRVPLAAATRAPAYEGELTDPASGSPRRFGLIALSGLGKTVALLLFGPRTSFLPEFSRLARSVQFLPDAFDPRLLGTADGVARNQAAGIAFDAPADWSCPTTLLFTDSSIEDICVRVSVEEPFSEARSFVAADELPAVDSDQTSILKETVTPVESPSQGWSGQWLVRHQSALGVRLVAIRKASVRVDSGEALTVYGKSPEKTAERLATAWESMLESVRARAS